MKQILSGLSYNFTTFKKWVRLMRGDRWMQDVGIKESSVIWGRMTKGHRIGSTPWDLWHIAYIPECEDLELDVCLNGYLAYRKMLRKGRYSRGWFNNADVE